MDTALLPHGPRWKSFHAVQASFLNVRKCQLYRPLQDLESRQLFFNLLTTNNFSHEFYRYTSSLVLTLVYGQRLVSGDEPELKQIEQLLTSIFKACALGNWLVDAFPILNYIPRPFAKWKLIGDDLHRRQSQLYQTKFNDALGASRWNWCKQSVADSASFPGVSRDELPFVLGDIFGAGGRTTAGALEVAILACVSYPDTMRHAQEELDKVVGGGRLPVFSDINDLPYIRAFIEEVLRWRSLAPGGVSHSPTKNDEYDGYFIPRGAVVIANHWSLEMDENVFQSPNEFIPDRWIGSDLPLAAFGFGKRTCPGQHLARNSIMLALPRILWAFDIKWKHGHEQNPDCLPMTQDGIFSKPGPFEVVFKIRSPAHLEIVTRGCQNLNEDVDGIMHEMGRQFVTV